MQENKPECQGCAVNQGYVPAGAVMQIQDAGQLPEIKDMLNAPQILNNDDRAFWVLGWNECRDAAKPLIARIAELEAQLVTEAARTAQEKLRANQMTEQHSMQAKIHAQALAQLAAVQQGVQQAAPAMNVSQETIDFLKESMQDCDDSARDVAISHDLEKILLAATHPTQQGLEPVEQRQLDIGKAIERACIDLPQGTELVVSLEKDAGTVTLFDSNGNEFDHFNEDCETFAERINTAIDGVIAAELVAAQAKQGEQA